MVRGQKNSPRASYVAVCSHEQHPPHESQEAKDEQADEHEAQAFAQRHVELRGRGECEAIQGYVRCACNRGPPAHLVHAAQHQQHDALNDDEHRERGARCANGRVNEHADRERNRPWRDGSVFLRELHRQREGRAAVMSWFGKKAAAPTRFSINDLMGRAEYLDDFAQVARSRAGSVH